MEVLEPWGDRHNDLRFGFLLSLLANIHRGKNSSVSKPWEWFASLADLSQGMDMKDPKTIEAIKAFARGHNKKPVKKNGRRR